MTDSVNPTNDCNESQESIDKKLLNEFKKYEKGFTEKSKPAYWNECAEKITLKEIHDNANIGDSPVVLIAVTRQQYNLHNFSKFRKYLKDVVKTDTIYYGLWPDAKNNKVEYDILYTIENNSEEIQKHLNLHNQMNEGLVQKMALIIDKNGNWKVEKNKNL
jgi:hypothetical protein